MNLLFRVDASNIIGTGHIYRCINLASIYKKQYPKINIYFISKNHPFNLNEKIREKFTCFEINLNNSNNINLNIDTWLGESQLIDSKKTISVIEQNNLKIDWLIIDHYAINYIWENELKKYVKNICVIDDFTNRKHNCNILINQQINNNEIIKYKNIVNNDCKVLTGNDYLFFHDKYYDLEINKNIKSLKRINIFMGGADTHNITNTIIDICYNFNKNNNLNIIFDVLIGKSNKYYHQLENKLKEYENFNLYYNLNFIGDLLLKADLAIGAPGTSSYERCLTLTPTLMICLATNQKTVIQKFIDSETAIYLGDINSNYKEKLLNNLQFLNDNPNELNKISINCKKFINIKKNKVKTIFE